MLEIVVASGKGGVGKTLVSSSIAVYLATRGYNVIAVDADADAPNLHIALGVREWSVVEEVRDAWVAEIDYSRCDGCRRCVEVCAFNAARVEDGRVVINDVICEGCVTCSLVCPTRAIRRRRVVSGYLRAADTPYGLRLWSAESIPGRPNTGKLVTEVKSKARAEARHDTVIVVDAAAGIGCQVVSSLAGANAVILVAEPTPASLSDLKRVHTVAKQFRLPAALVVNKYDLNPGYTRRIVEYAEEEGIDVLGYIPYDDNVALAAAEERPFILAYPDSPAAKALVEIARRVEERIVRGYERWMREHMPKRPAVYTPIIIKPEGKP